MKRCERTQYSTAVGSMVTKVLPGVYLYVPGDRAFSGCTLSIYRDQGLQRFARHLSGGVPIIGSN